MFGSSKERVSELERALSKVQGEIQFLRRELDAAHEEVKRLRMAKGFAEIMLEAEKETNIQLSAKLAETEKNPCPPRRHNERGAGRKPRATPEIIGMLHALQEHGVSLKQMAGELTVQTREPWSKSAVAYILKKYERAEINVK